MRRRPSNRMPRQQFPTARTEGTLRTPTESALPKKLPTTCQNRVRSLRLQAKQKGQKSRGQKSGLCIGAGQKPGLCIGRGRKSALCIGFGREPGPFPPRREAHARALSQKPSSRARLRLEAPQGGFRTYTQSRFLAGTYTQSPILSTDHGCEGPADARSRR